VLRLLYLSDIHFREPECLNSRMDVASKDRKLLIDDLEEIIQATGKSIDAIVVTGDITFKANPVEFDTAEKWLQEIADKNGIDKSKIFVVPGNHDVDRTIADHAVNTAFRDGINRLEEPAKHQRFLDTLKDEKTQKLILEPMENYNQFAKQYDCNIELPNKPFWTHYLNINDKYQLCLNGLTTTFFSSSADELNSLYLGESQAYIEKKKGIVNLAMFHHPKDWLGDGDEFDDLLADNVQIWLSGHKHRQRYTTDGRYLDLPSAAVSPSVWEPGLPGYNIIDISVSEDVEHANLELSIMMRMLQGTPKQYVAKKTHEREDLLIHTIKIPKANDLIPKHINLSPKPNTGNSSSENVCGDTSDFKNLASRIWDLQMSKRMSIFKALKLEVDCNPLTNEEGFIRQALEIIKNNNLLGELESLIIEQEKA
jgi:predicted MPP superfamily phosphohydrolase